MNFKFKAGLVAVAGAVALAGCSSFNGASTQWPEYSKAQYEDEQKAYPDPAVFKKLGNEASRAQVAQLLGLPHFRDSNIASAQAWDYVFRFRTQPNGDPSTDIICQYKVQFNGDGYVKSTYWHAAQPKDAKCPAEVQVPLAAQQPQQPQQPQNRTFNLASDSVFDFDSANIKAKGAGELDKLVQGLGQLQGLRAVQIIGYTDPMGDAKYNQQLSERRARAVGEYLVRRGVPAQAIQVAGRGEDNLKVDNCGTKGAQARACNAPNRRVEIIVQGQTAR